MRPQIVSCALVAALASSLLCGPADAQTPRAILVFAGASLTEAFDEIGTAFTKKTGVPVTFHYAGADALATQIEAGAPADVFASANEKQLKMVAAAGLLAGPSAVFARNAILLITPKHDAAVTRIADLAKPDVKVVLEAPSVPDGMYARMAFGMLSGHDGYPSDFPAAVEKNVSSDEMDITAVTTKVALGEADAGVVFTTSMTPSVAGQLNAIPFPVQPDVEYPIAAVKNDHPVPAAQAFVDFVLSPAGQAILRRHGFAAP